MDTIKNHTVRSLNEYGQSKTRASKPVECVCCGVITQIPCETVAEAIECPRYERIIEEKKKK